jgi:16S rRNA (guanine527-N7)-methyltransferase
MSAERKPAGPDGATGGRRAQARDGPSATGSIGLPERAAGALSESGRRQLARVLEAIAADAHAPTAIREPGRAGELHVADSLVALELARVRDARAIADLGSGSGFPGVALAVALPAASVRLIESQQRKCRFLERLCRIAAIENAEVVWTRAEEWGEGACAHDLVVARALAAQPVVLEYAAPLLRVGGALVDWRGRRAPADEDQAQRAAAVLGLRREEVRAVRPFSEARDRHLHVFVKERTTPSRFPRRAGMAGKRPLGS